MVNKWLKDGRARYAQARSGFLSYSAQCTWEEIKHEAKNPADGRSLSIFSLWRLEAWDWKHGFHRTDGEAMSRTGAA